MQESSVDIPETQRALAIASTHRDWESIEEIMWKDLQCMKTRTITLPLPLLNDDGLICPCGKGTQNRTRIIEGAVLLLAALGIGKSSPLAKHQHTRNAMKEIVTWIHEQWTYCNDYVPLQGMKSPLSRKMAIDEVEAAWDQQEPARELPLLLPVGTIRMGQPGQKTTAYLLESTASPASVRNVPPHIRSLLLAQWTCMEARELYSWAWAPNVEIEFAANAQRMPKTAASSHYTALRRLMDEGPDTVRLRIVNLGVEALVERLTSAGAQQSPAVPRTAVSKS